MVDKRIWHNFIAHSKTKHAWQWQPDAHMHAFFLWSGWGVTTQWLRQMARRLVHHFASFQGEAKVHRAEAVYQGNPSVVPYRADLKMMRAWLMWRVVIRKVQHASAFESGCPLGPGLNLLQDPEDVMEDMWDWYPEHMLQRRLQKCESLGEDVTKLVVDGNLKLSRRVCGRPVAELTESKELTLEGIFLFQ